jgi:hypothetical protein
MSENYLKLIEDESILFQSKPRVGKFHTYFPPFVFGIGAFLLSLFGIAIVREEFKLLVLLIAILFGFISGVLSFDSLLKGDQAKYYITSKRIIISHDKGFLPYRFRDHQMLLDDLSFICKEWGDLAMVSKGLHNKTFYRGDEIRINYKLLKGMKIISFFFRDMEGNIINQAVDVLVELCALEKHPNIKNLFIRTNIT